MACGRWQVGEEQDSCLGIQGPRIGRRKVGSRQKAPVSRSPQMMPTRNNSILNLSPTISYYPFGGRRN